MSSFHRGLSPVFLAALDAGPLQPVVRAALAHGLDLQIRENYVNLYKGRTSVLKLSHHPKRAVFKASIHDKYRPDALASVVSGNYRTRRLSIKDAADWALTFEAALPSLLVSARPFDKPEGATEYEISMAHRATPLTIIDRQIQLSGVKDSRLDSLGVLDEGPGAVPSLVLLELKAGDALDVKEVLDQVDRYRRLYLQAGKLRPDVADRLQDIWTQKITLGVLKAPTKPLILRDLRLECLVVLSSSRGARSLQSLGHRPSRGDLVRYVGVPTSAPAIPSPSTWETLRG